MEILPSLSRSIFLMVKSIRSWGEMETSKTPRTKSYIRVSRRGHLEDILALVLGPPEDEAVLEHRHHLLPADVAVVAGETRLVKGQAQGQGSLDVVNTEAVVGQLLPGPFLGVDQVHHGGGAGGAGGAGN